jgi:hypothetical protein
MDSSNDKLYNLYLQLEPVIPLIESLEERRKILCIHICIILTILDSIFSVICWLLSKLPLYSSGHSALLFRGYLKSFKVEKVCVN